MIEIMNLRNTKPSEKWDFYVDRRSPVGNWYPLKSEENRDRVCDAYIKWFNNAVTQRTRPLVIEYLAILLSSYRLYGKLRLFCWCAPKRCHAETIRRYILREKGEDGES